MFQQKFKRCLRPILDQMLGVCNSPWDIPYIFFLNSSKVLYWADKAGSCPWGGVPAPAWSLQIYGAPVPDWSTWVPLRGYLVGSFRNSQPSLEYSWAFEGATNRADITVMMPKVQDSQMWKLSFGGAGSWGIFRWICSHAYWLNWSLAGETTMTSLAFWRTARLLSLGWWSPRKHDVRHETSRW